MFPSDVRRHGINTTSTDVFVYDLSGNNSDNEFILAIFHLQLATLCIPQLS